MSKLAHLDIPLLLFAKAPIAGHVKTRLQSHCSAEQAAKIAEILLHASLVKVCQHWPGRVYMSTWIDFDHPFLLEMCDRFGVTLLRQCEGDLGDKMHNAFEQHGYPMAIMGSDAPHIAEDDLIELHKLLHNGESAIGPSLDGGYYIIGLSQPAPFLFKDMPWGGNQVLGLCRQAAASHHFKLRELGALQDIDEWSDLLAALPVLPELEQYLQDQALI